MMKKTLIRCAAVLLLIACALSAASCSLFAPKPETDVKVAATTLERNGYLVETIEELEGDSRLGIGIKRAFRASYTYGIALNEKSLVMIEFRSPTTAKLYYEEKKAEYDAEIEEISHEIKVYKHLLADYKSRLNGADPILYEEMIEELEEELETLKKEYTVGRSGKVVWYGSTDVIEDTK